MTDHSEHALGFQIGLQAGIADAVRAVLADQPAVRIQHRNAGQSQPLRILPQLILAAVKRHALQLLNGGRFAHKCLGHGGFVILHIGGGLLLYKVDQLGHAPLAVLHIRVPGQQEYRTEEQKTCREAQAPERPLGDNAPGIIVQAAPPPDCARGPRDIFRPAVPCCRPRASA